NGMPRFFRRLSEGVFDEQDLVKRTDELKQFIDEKAMQYKFNRQEIYAIGYSNGANIAASLLFHYENVVAWVMLHYPMVPNRNIDLPNLAKLPVVIGAGTSDTICPAVETEDLTGLLTNAGAEVDVHWENNGHQLTPTEIQAAMEWYKNLG